MRVSEGVRICRTPRCEDEVGEGLKFCPKHWAFYMRMRDEIEAGKEQRLRSAGVRSPRRRVCANPGCAETAIRGQGYCGGCAEL